MVEYVQNSKRGDFLKYEGHLFVKDKEKNGRVYWKCKEFHSKSCHRRLHLENNQVINELGEHSHAANAAELEVVEALQEMREQASTTPISTHRLVAETVANLSAPAKATMPPVSSMERTVRRVRNYVQG